MPEDEYSDIWADLERLVLEQAQYEADPSYRFQGLDCPECGHATSTCDAGLYHCLSCGRVYEEGRFELYPVNPVLVAKSMGDRINLTLWTGAISWSNSTQPGRCT